MTTSEPLTAVSYVYQADLSDARPGFTYVLRAGEQEVPLALHTTETRAAARAANPALASLADDELTHFSPAVLMPLDSVRRVHITGIPRDGDGLPYVHAVAITCAPAAHPGSILFEQINYPSTAQSFLFHHPDLMSSNAGVARLVMEHLSRDTAPETYDSILALALVMKRQGPPTADEKKGWAQLLPFESEDGQTLYQQRPSVRTTEAARTAMMRIQITTKNDLRLKDKKWTPQQGFSVVTDSKPSEPTLVAFLETDGDAVVRAEVTTRVDGLQTTVRAPATSGNGIRAGLSMRNYYLRYLGAYIQFLDVNGAPMKTPEWSPDGTAPAPAFALQSDDLRFLGSLASIDTILGIPDFALPGAVDVDITFPAGAVAARIYGLGLGTGENPYPVQALYGGIRTYFANLAIPTLLLAFTAISSPAGELADILKLPAVSRALQTIGATYGVYFVGNSVVEGKVDWRGVSMIGQLLFQKGVLAPALEPVTRYAAKAITKALLEREIPFVGWAATAISVIAGVAQLTQTIVEVATSPWAIGNRLTTSITSTVRIEPDPRKTSFPGSAGLPRSYNVRLVYQGSQPTMSVTRTLEPESVATVLLVQLTNNLGGFVKFQCDFFVGSQIAASASTAWLPNDGIRTTDVKLFLFETPILLDEHSVYEHAALLTYQEGAYRWMSPARAPVSTMRDLSSANTGNAISDLTGLSLSQRRHQLGCAWKAAGLGIADCTGTTDTQLYALQSVDTPGLPMDDARFSRCGYSVAPNVAYDPYPARFLMKDGQFLIGEDGRPKVDPDDRDLGLYFVDPAFRNLSDLEGGGYHLRRIPDNGTEPIPTGEAARPSFGRFPLLVDALILHPSGRVVAINKEYSTLMVTTLETNGRPDAEVPLARKSGGPAIDYRTPGGTPTDRLRPGLLANPIAIASTYDGTVLVLEDAGDAPAVSRIQAFDGNADPVDAFPGDGGALVPFLELPTGRHYLDLTVVGNADLAYIYVLYYDHDGAVPENYNVAVYRTGATVPRSTTPLLTVPGVSAARLAVDLFRTLYTLNWSITTGADGKPAGPPGGTTGPAGRTVPSLSQWLPRQRPQP
jgi:hypothetical protein